MTWKLAHRVAGIAAVHARTDLGLPQDRYVDIFAGVASLPINVMVQQLGTLFGAYLPETADQAGGILLNGRMDETTLRHSAGHEVGHFLMGHGVCASEEVDILRVDAERAWSAQEKEAEAFAAWLLMPPGAVRRGLRHLGIRRPQTAEDVYQLSLHLGTSYRGTLRHLVSLHVVETQQERAWRSATPASMRARLVGSRVDIPSRVWRLAGAATGAELHVRPGDRLILEGSWINAHTNFKVPEDVMIVDDDDSLFGRVSFDIGALGTTDDLRVSASDDNDDWSVALIPARPPRHGLLSGDHFDDIL